GRYTLGITGPANQNGFSQLKTPVTKPTAWQESTPAPPSISAADAGLSATAPLRSTSNDSLSLPPPPSTAAPALPLFGLTGPNSRPLLRPSSVTLAVTRSLPAPPRALRKNAPCICPSYLTLITSSPAPPSASAVSCASGPMLTLLVASMLIWSLPVPPL